MKEEYFDIVSVNRVSANSGAAEAIDGITL
jgi:hypothetical protein